LAFAFHEQDAVELEGLGGVQIVGALVGVERFDRCGRHLVPAVGEGAQRPAVALQAHGLFPGSLGVELLVFPMKRERFSMASRNASVMGST